MDYAFGGYGPARSQHAWPGPYDYVDTGYGKHGSKGRGKESHFQEESSGDPEKDRLIARVKDIQRRDPELGRVAWERFADATRMGSRDPSRHPKENLSTFLDALDRGEDTHRAAAKCGGGKVLRLRGVPFQSELKDVVDFLAEFKVLASQIVFGRKPDGKPTGEAYAIFRSGTQAERALDELQKQEIHGRWIELFRSSQEEYDKAASISPAGQHATGDWEKDELVAKVKKIQRMGGDMAREMWYNYVDATRTGMRDPARHTTESLTNFVEAYERGEVPQVPEGILLGKTKIMRLRGVPYQCDVPEVLGFLKDFDIDPSQIAMGYGPEGKKTGEAFVVFPTEELAEKAFDEKQKQEIQGRYIELFKANQEEMDRCLANNPTRRAAAEQASLGDAASSAQGGITSWRDYTGGDEKAVLIAEVKRIQRASIDGRERWEKFCSGLQTGNRDPRLHGAESLRTFLEAYERGEDPELAVEKIRSSNKVVRLRGVPFQGTVQDVANFLSEYGIDRSQIALGQHADTGKPNGEAFVVFNSVADADDALGKKQKQEIGGRFIELFRSCQEDFDRFNAPVSSMAMAAGVEGGQQHAPSKEELVVQVKRVQKVFEDGKDKWEEFCAMVRTGNRDPARHTAEALTNFLEAHERGEPPKMPSLTDVVRLRGVPFQSELSHVVDFVAEYRIPEGAIILGRGDDGKKTGEAYVTCPSVEVAERILQEKQKQEINGRYIEIFRASYEDRDEAQVNQELFIRQQGGRDAISKEALVAEVKHLQRKNEDGRTRWDSFCELLRNGIRDPSRHTAEALRAFAKAMNSGHSIEETVADLCRGNKLVRLRGVPFQGGIPDVLDFLAEYHIREQDITFIMNQDGRPTGEAFVMFPTQEGAENAMDTKQKMEIRGRYIELFRSSQAEIDDYIALQSCPPAQQSVPDTRPARRGDEMRHDRPAPAATAAPPTLKLRGLPFDATPREIVDFLNGFGIVYDQVVLDVKADGRPNGQAFVACYNHDQARDIAHARHGKNLGKRYVEILEGSFDEWQAAARATGREDIFADPAPKGGGGGFGGKGKDRGMRRPPPAGKGGFPPRAAESWGNSDPAWETWGREAAEGLFMEVMDWMGGSPKGGGKSKHAASADWGMGGMDGGWASGDAYGMPKGKGGFKGHSKGKDKKGGKGEGFHRFGDKGGFEKGGFFSEGGFEKGRGRPGPYEQAPRASQWDQRPPPVRSLEEMYYE